MSEEERRRTGTGDLGGVSGRMRREMEEDNEGELEKKDRGEEMT